MPRFEAVTAGAIEIAGAGATIVGAIVAGGDAVGRTFGFNRGVTNGEIYVDAVEVGATKVEDSGNTDIDDIEGPEDFSTEIPEVEVDKESWTLFVPLFTADPFSN